MLATPGGRQAASTCRGSRCLVGHLRHVRVRYSSTGRESRTAEFVEPCPRYPMAKTLAETNVWAAKPQGKPRPKPPVYGDKSRVNLVSEKLCLDIYKYIGPSLQRHVGCDLIDLFPGAGVWSRRLNDVLRPRSHILMEPEEELYTPFLKRLLIRPGTKLVPKSGLVWSEVDAVLESLPLQKPMADGAIEYAPKRNDTLLVTANLAAFPKSGPEGRTVPRYINQLVSAIRSQTIFQRYGLVRMLIWARPDHLRASVLPAMSRTRNKTGADGEMSCEWVHEVAGPDYLEGTVRSESFSNRTFGYVRTEWMEVMGAHHTLRRMREQGLTTPRARMSGLLKIAGRKSLPTLSSPEEIEGLIKASAKAKVGANPQASPAKQEKLERRVESDIRDAEPFAELLHEYLSLLNLRKQGEDTTEMEQVWNDKVESLSDNALYRFRGIRHNVHITVQDDPPLHWDRRTYEPLLAQDREFYPMVGCSLVDIQPKAPNPLILGSSTDAKIYDLLLGIMLRLPVNPISEQLDAFWPGTSDAILASCPSLYDPSKGGGLSVRQGEVTARSLNETQWLEILQAWKDWRFRPSIERLQHYHMETVEEEDESNVQRDAEFYL